MRARLFTLSILTLLLATLAHAVFVLPDQIVVPVRADSGTGTGYDDRVADGVETPAIGGGPASSVELAFSDLTSGPDVGLGDGLGSGVIVTVWGYGLGSSQGASTIEFCDSAAVCRVPYVYYWKNADGTAPSGPANLYESHGMQEIAFSIPDSAMGTGTIRVTVAGNADALPFTVRTGNIYHVMSSGSNTNPGTFSQPWQTAARVGHSQSGATAPAGSTTYFHGITSGTALSDARGMYFNLASASAVTPDQQFFYVAYPGAHSTTLGREGFTNYQVQGASISKFRVGTSNCVETANGQRTGCTSVTPGTWGVQTDKWGRVIANYFYEPAGTCSSATAGAIIGDANFADNVSDARMFGNEIEGHGCQASSPLHHTTYMSIRSAPDDLQLPAWEWGWNYLHDNWAKSGIHQFDQDTGCGDLTTPLRIHNNVIINQAGPGIYVGGQCGWSMDAYIENNVIINAGLPSTWDGVTVTTTQQPEPGGVVIRDSGTPPTGGLLGTMYVRNNTIHTVGPSGAGDAQEGCLTLTGSGDSVAIVFTHNICVNPRDYGFITASGQSGQQLNNLTGIRNVFYYSGAGTPVRAVVPTWDLSPITTNPLLTISGSRVSVGNGSPVIDQSGTALIRDIYGTLRTKPNSNLGAVE